MMRELGTVSPVVWPAWCYSGEGQSESDSTPTATEPNHQQQTSATPTTAAATPPSSTVSPTKTRGKRRNNNNHTNLSSVTMNGGSDIHNNNNNNSSNTNNNNNNNNDEVKTERLSPTSTTTTFTATTTTTTAGAASAITPDNASSSSRSATPSSSYPGTPPGLVGADRGSSPSSLPGGHIKHMEQMMSRNYSDFMRSLAAKYNNANPNDSYFSGTPRNGFPVNLDPRFSPFKTETTPFISLMGPLGPTTATMPSPVHKNNHIASGSSTATTVTTKDSLADMSHDKKSSPSSSSSSSLEAQQQALYASFAANPFGGAANPSLFPPLIDMSSTQALLNMVRTANAHNAASQLETYLKTTNKRPAPSESSPLDLSSAAVAPTYLKKSRTTKSLSVSESLYGDSLLHIPMVDALRTSKERLGKRYGSVSPKPPSRIGGSGGSSAGSSPRLLPPSTVTSLNVSVGATTTHPLGRTLPCLSMCGGADRTCGDNNQALASWGIEDVCNFVTTIDLCAEYAPNFREQRIDGSGLPLLTEDHLTSTLGMKLGPALKLRATLARRLGHCSICQHCVHCHVTSVPTASVSPSQTPLTVRPNSTGN